MIHRSWMRAERLSWPVVAAELAVRGVAPAPDLAEERIAFGGHPSQHLLVIRPKSPSGATPAVYFLHGGSWRSGTPEQYRAIGRYFARHGHVAVLGGYRLVPEHIFPAQLDDAFAGLAALARMPWFAESCGRRVVVAGHSAGGHLAALAAFDSEGRARHGLGELDIAGVLAVSAVLDLAVLCPHEEGCPLVAALMGGRGGWECADPAHFAHLGPQLPVLCLHGSRDPLVPAEVAASFVLRANGSEGEHAAFLADPQGHHSDLIRVLYGRSPLTLAMTAWLEDVSQNA